MTLPAAGTAAPDFTLPSTAGSTVTLSALRGEKVLLAFFPAAFTSVCSEELCALSEDYDAFRQSDTVVLPISVDQTPSLKAFRAQEGMQVDLLSDTRRDVCRAYGVLNPDRFNAERAYVLIDRDGIVRWTFREEHPGFRRQNADLLVQLDRVP